MKKGGFQFKKKAVDQTSRTEYFGCPDFDRLCDFR